MLTDKQVTTNAVIHWSDAYKNAVESNQVVLDLLISQFNQLVSKEYKNTGLNTTMIEIPWNPDYKDQIFYLFIDKISLVGWKVSCDIDRLKNVVVIHLST